VYPSPFALLEVPRTSPSAIFLHGGYFFGALSMFLNQLVDYSFYFHTGNEHRPDKAFPLHPQEDYQHERAEREEREMVRVDRGHLQSHDRNFIYCIIIAYF